MSAANRRARGPRSERSERRREGYPPEGTRPRSGLGRVARSRSDAPGSFFGRGWRESNSVSVARGESESNSSSASYRRGRSIRICWRANCWRRRRKGEAAQPPRSAAPQARRYARQARFRCARADGSQNDRTEARSNGGAIERRRDRAAGRRRRSRMRTPASERGERAKPEASATTGRAYQRGVEPRIGCGRVRECEPDRGGLR